MLERWGRSSNVSFPLLELAMSLPWGIPIKWKRCPVYNLNVSLIHLNYTISLNFNVQCSSYSMLRVCFFSAALLVTLVLVLAIAAPILKPHPPPSEQCQKTAILVMRGLPHLQNRAWKISHKDHDVSQSNSASARMLFVIVRKTMMIFKTSAAFGSVGDVLDSRVGLDYHILVHTNVFLLWSYK